MADKLTGSSKIEASGAPKSSRPKPPNAGKGRPKGAVNRVSASAKEALMQAYNELGGVQGMVTWARKKENRANFYFIWSKLLPHEVRGPSGPIEVRVTFKHEGRRITAS